MAFHGLRPPQSRAQEVHMGETRKGGVPELYDECQYSNSPQPVRSNSSYCHHHNLRSETFSILISLRLPICIPHKHYTSLQSLCKVFQIFTPLIAYKRVEWIWL